MICLPIRTLPMLHKTGFKSLKPYDWYDQNADQYFQDTTNFSMEEKYPQLLNHIPKGGHILDAGCGAGRDIKAFLEKGYKVSAFDASSKLAAKASAYTGINVQTATFENFKSPKKYDGIWSSASLLHVPKKDFEKAFINLTDHLKPNGVIWVTLKTGDSGEEFDDKGRFFNYVSKQEMKDMIAKHKNLELIKSHEEKNTFRKGDHPFLNLVVKKVK